MNKPVKQVKKTVKNPLKSVRDVTGVTKAKEEAMKQQQEAESAMRQQAEETKKQIEEMKPETTPAAATGVGMADPGTSGTIQRRRRASRNAFTGARGLTTKPMTTAKKTLLGG